MDFEPTAWSCSFCGKRGTADTRYAAGLGALMCTECLTTFFEAFAAPENVSQRVIGWYDDSMSDADMLARLPLIAATAGQVDRYLRMWVGRIRERHISYAEIGKALGVSRQAAWERFSRVVDCPQQQRRQAAGLTRRAGGLRPPRSRPGAGPALCSAPSISAGCSPIGQPALGHLTYGCELRRPAAPPDVDMTFCSTTTPLSGSSTSSGAASKNTSWSTTISASITCHHLRAPVSTSAGLLSGRRAHRRRLPAAETTGSQRVKSRADRI